MANIDISETFNATPNKIELNGDKLKKFIGQITDDSTIAKNAQDKIEAFIKEQINDRGYSNLNKSFQLTNIKSKILGKIDEARIEARNTLQNNSKLLPGVVAPEPSTPVQVAQAPQQVAPAQTAKVTQGTKESSVTSFYTSLQRAQRNRGGSDI